MDVNVFRAWITSAAEVIQANSDHLTQLDAAIGDADHGGNMARGFAAVLAALDAKPAATPGAVLILTGYHADLQGRRRLRPAVRNGVPPGRSGPRHRRGSRPAAARPGA